VPHAVENRGAETLRLAVTQLIPKGAEATTFLK
jgi:hypothetical protein